MTKSVSIALATFNGRAFLPQQLASLAAQTTPPAELVVCDDTSSDGTIACLERFARQAPFPVHIHRNATRLGYRANFMRAASLCGSDLVALCDQDDVWAPGKLQVAAAAFNDEEVTLFFHDAWLADAAGVRTGPADAYRLPALNPPGTISHRIRPWGFAIMFDRALMQFADLWEQSIDWHDQGSRMGHDQWLFLLGSTFGTVAYSKQRLADYRQHGRNTFGAGDNRLGARWRDRFTSQGVRYAHLSRTARSWATILGQAQARLSGVWLERAVAGERACHRLADRLALQQRLHGRAALVERARLVLRLCREGAYGRDDASNLGGYALAQDIAFGVLLQPLLFAAPANTPVPLSPMPLSLGADLRPALGAERRGPAGVT